MRRRGSGRGRGWRDRVARGSHELQRAGHDPCQDRAREGSRERGHDLDRGRRHDRWDVAPARDHRGHRRPI